MICDLIAVSPVDKLLGVDETDDGAVVEPPQPIWTPTRQIEIPMHAVGRFLLDNTIYLL